MIALEDLTAGASVRGLLASGVTPVESVRWISQQAVKVTFCDGEGRQIRLRPMISVGRAEPVAVAKRGPPVVVVMAVEGFERPKAPDASAKARAAERRAKE